MRKFGSLARFLKSYSLVTLIRIGINTVQYVWDFVVRFHLAGYKDNKLLQLVSVSVRGKDITYWRNSV